MSILPTGNLVIPVPSDLDEEQPRLVSAGDEAISQGQAVYFEPNGAPYVGYNRAYNTNVLKAAAYGIAVSPAAAGQNFGIMVRGRVNFQQNLLTIGAQYYLTSDYGGIGIWGDVLIGQFVTYLFVAETLQIGRMNVDRTGLVKGPTTTTSTTTTTTTTTP